MQVFVALLRAVNVGGTGKLSMKELRSLCEGAGLEDVKTYIQSGNVVFRTGLSAPRVETKLEKTLTARMGRRVGVLVRTGAELDRIVECNPFVEAAPNRVIVFFLDETPPPDALEGWRIPGRERMALGGREVFIHFPDGQGRSKLRIPFADTATGRNLRTVTRLADMARALDGG